MSLLWYYRPEHTDQGRKPGQMEDEVFASRHKDVNSVACIEDKCYVLTYNEYCRYMHFKNLWYTAVLILYASVVVVRITFYLKKIVHRTITVFIFILLLSSWEIRLINTSYHSFCPSFYQGHQVLACKCLIERDFKGTMGFTLILITLINIIIGNYSPKGYSIVFSMDSSLLIGNFFNE